MLLAASGRLNGVLRSVEDDRGDVDPRLGRDLVLGVLVARVAGGQPVPMPVGVDDHVDEVRVGERHRGPAELLVGEGPTRRPLRPQGPGELDPVSRQTGPAAIAVKVVLVPQSALDRWFGRCQGVGDLLPVVADQSGHPVGLQGGDQA